MAAIKAVSVISEKWSRVTPQRAADYAAGVKSPTKSWQDGALAAADAQAQGVTEALANKSFEKGVAAAGNAKWQRKASTVGAARFGPGVQAAKPDYEAGFAPYVGVISGVTLPPRGSKGDPRNYERVKAMGEALHAAKIGK